MRGPSAVYLPIIQHSILILLLLLLLPCMLALLHGLPARPLLLHPLFFLLLPQCRSQLLSKLTGCQRPRTQPLQARGRCGTLARALLYACDKCGLASLALLHACSRGRLAWRRLQAIGRDGLAW
jgi:hypothetical protein